MSTFRRRLMELMGTTPSILIPEINIPNIISRPVDTSVVKSISLANSAQSKDITFTRSYSGSYTYSPEYVDLYKNSDLKIVANYGHANTTYTITYKNFNKGITITTENTDIINIGVPSNGNCDITTITTGTAVLTIKNGNDLIGTYSIVVADNKNNIIEVEPTEINVYYAGPIGTPPSSWDKLSSNMVPLMIDNNTVRLQPPTSYGNELPLGIYYMNMVYKGKTCTYPVYPNMITIIDGDDDSTINP